MGEYTINLIGRKRYNELVKEYNLCTKKWTIGRTKDFYKAIKKEIKKANRRINNE